MLQRKYILLLALMFMLHIIYHGWKILLPPFFYVSQPFGTKMVGMVGMCILTVIVFFVSQ